MPFGKLLERRAGHDGKGRSGGLIVLGGQITKRCGIMGLAAQHLIDGERFFIPAAGLWRGNNREANGSLEAPSWRGGPLERASEHGGQAVQEFPALAMLRAVIPDAIVRDR